MADWRRNESYARYAKSGCTRFSLKLSDKTDGDLIRWLRHRQQAGEPIQGYIRRLVREDMERQRGDGR